MNGIRIVTLMDNNLKEPLKCEHGLSLYIETDRHRILADTGSSYLTWENAAGLNVNLSAIDTVFLSHGHYDHCGGVMSLMEYNSKAKIYIHTGAEKDYYSFKDSAYKYIGIDKNILNLPNLITIKDSIIIDDELSVFSGVNGRRLWPSGNKRLFEKRGNQYIQDEFTHEQYLVIQYDKDKKALISGCAHNGILNILSRFSELYKTDPDLVISGFHTVKHEYMDSDIEDLRAIGEELKKMNTVFYTGHCTGDYAYSILKEIMEDKLHLVCELR